VIDHAGVPGAINQSQAASYAAQTLADLVAQQASTDTAKITSFCNGGGIVDLLPGKHAIGKLV